MDPQAGGGTHEHPDGRVHVLGAGPVGLLLTALLQPLDGAAVHLYEKRRDYTRTRMVRLGSYLVADSVEAYRADHYDGDNVEAVFDPSELAAGLAFRQSIPPDLMELLRGWTRGFIPLNAIESSISELIDARHEYPVERIATALTAEDAIAMLEPGDVLIDCTGSRSLLRDRLIPGSDGLDEDANTLSFLFEHALVVTFLYSQTYSCNEYCKYYKNVENPHYKFIPMVSRVSYDGTMSHVTGHRHHQSRGVRGDAGPVRRRVAARQLAGRCPVDGAFHRQDQAGDTRRGRRRPRHHPHPPEPLPRT